MKKNWTVEFSLQEGGQVTIKSTGDDFKPLEKIGLVAHLNSALLRNVFEPERPKQPETLQEFRQALANRIKGGMAAKGLSKGQFAKAMGVTSPVVTKWLKGDCNFECTTLFKMEDVLGITLIGLN